jgi:hypothetical protein
VLLLFLSDACFTNDAERLSFLRTGSTSHTQS